MRGVTGFLYSLTWTLSTLYFVQIVGLNPLQLVLVGTILEASVFLFEIPTGIVADLYSRKVSVIIGFALIGAGFIVQGTIPHFAAILLAQVLWGVGYTFTSGADSAWISDELGEQQLGTIFMHGSQSGQVGALLGIGASVVLAKSSLSLPISMGGIVFVGLAAFLAFFMPETGFKPTPQEDRNSWQAMAATFKSGLSAIKASPALVVLLVIGLFYGLSSEGIDRLWQVHVMDVFPPSHMWDLTAWFGVISACTHVLGIAVVHLITKKADLKNFTGISTLLVWVNTGFIISVLAFAASGNFTVAVACYLSMALFRRVNGPLHQAWLNRSIPSQVKATVLSMGGQVDALGQIVGGPIIGFAATRFSIAAGIVAAGVILIPIPFLFTLVKGGTTKAVGTTS